MYAELITRERIKKRIRRLTYKTFIVWRLLLKLIRHDFDPDEWWWRKMYAELITRERIKKPTYKTFIVWRLLLKLIRHDFDPDEWWWRKMYAELITRERIKKTQRIRRLLFEDCY